MTPEQRRKASCPSCFPERLLPIDPVVASLGRAVPAVWSFTLYPDAREAGGAFVPSRPRAKASQGVRGQAADPERARLEAARRARGRVRRYCAANRLNRLGTLTFRGEGCHDQRLLRDHLGVFFRRMRHEVGSPFPYVWVPEWHKTDHGLHAHFAVGRFIKRSVVQRAWGHGFVHIKLLGDLPVGSGALGEARAAAGYLSKYVTKSFDDRRISGLHRFDLAQGFQPRVHRLTGQTPGDVVSQASVLFGSGPALRWSSSEVPDWQGGPAIWAQWA